MNILRKLLKRKRRKRAKTRLDEIDLRMHNEAMRRDRKRKQHYIS